jgi:hypothetical protein
VSHAAWKKRERAYARAFGGRGEEQGERNQDTHGPDFFYHGGPLRAEVKLRRQPPTKVLSEWLKDRDLLFTVAGGQRMEAGLVTMTVETFMKHFDWDREEAQPETSPPATDKKTD